MTRILSFFRGLTNGIHVPNLWLKKDRDVTIKSFNVRRLVQAAYVLQEKTSTTNYMKLIKLIFFADRFHLRNYGTLLTFDDYFAVKLGPLGSKTDNIFTKNSIFMKNLTREDREYIDQNIILLDGEKDIEIKKQDTSSLSISRLESLDFSASNFGKYQRYVLKDITHDYPEWKRYQTALESGSINRAPMYLIDFFNNPNISESKFINKYMGGRDPFSESPEALQGIKKAFLTFA